MPALLVTASSLNLRSAPRLANNIIGSLRKGARVDPLEPSADGLWQKVRQSKKIGWAFSKYLTPESDSSTPIVATEEFPWMPIALSEVGTREATGAGDNLRVLEYLRSTDLERDAASKDSTPWCSAFVNWCVEKSGFAGSNSARARSWLTWGKALSRPRRGCVVVFSRKGGGHVGFYVARDEDHYLVLGGNQSDEVRIAGYATSRLLGFRVPG
jgi:uncharacterized protein (TIGR02594 family)